MSAWLLYALLSALFASLIAIFGKLGLANIDANSATTIRAIIMALFLIGVITIQGKWHHLATIVSNRQALLLIALSGIAGALSWLFYFLAIQHGPVSKVAPIDKLSVVFSVILALILFQESISTPALFGVILITVGTLLVALF